MTASINDAYEEHERKRIQVHSGVCPECGGKLDAARPLRNFFFARGDIKQRQCYDCRAIYYIYAEEN